MAHTVVRLGVTIDAILAPSISGFFQVGPWVEKLMMVEEEMGWDGSGTGKNLDREHAGVAREGGVSILWFECSTGKKFHESDGLRQLA